MKKKVVILTTKDDMGRDCMCNFFNPGCLKYKECEELELEYNPYEGIEECMQQRSYKKVNGKIKQR